ncbi:hypothetical protein BY996DRAFT_6560765 [Phakopsora pachyrhizi]|nr:hypothetical protein BY996DRAFT_6560765 [Phakopsora pachyrhizi]
MALKSGLIQGFSDKMMRDGLAGLPVPDLKNSNLRRLIVSYYYYYDPRNWILEPYQSRWASLSIRTFNSHIYMAMREALKTSNQTISEAASYLRLSHQLGLLTGLGLNPGRITTEEFATSSLSNQEEKSFREARLNRNPFRRYTPYIDSCPELTGIDGGILLRGGGDDAAYAWTF